MEIDVAKWLGRLGLEEYAASFAQNKIDAAALVLLSDEDLKELGVRALGDRRKLTTAIADLRQGFHSDSQHERSRSAPQNNAPLLYTPDHLAARILNERDDLKGERKHVTVLFADIKGSTSLIDQADPEEAARKLGPTISRMMMAVHEYEGTVNRVQGDGIMALFGAPLAHEDHAQRACLAALAMRDAIAGAGEAEIEVRIGLHSGDVLVRTIHNDLSMDYDAIGPTVHLASRMEQIASPGSILMTASTQELAAGYFEMQSKGSQRVKGIGRNIHVFELLRRRPMGTRWEARSSRELTNFVGRTAELDSMLASVTRAESGRGELLALVGDAGMGKSRLVHELICAPQLESWFVVRTGTSPFGRNTAFMPLAVLLRSLFGIGEGDAKPQIVAKCEEGLSRHTATSTTLRSTVQFLLDLTIDDTTWLGLDPRQRRNLIIEDLRGFLLQIAQDRPLLLVFEDLHWIDPESQGLLDALAVSLGGHPILLLVTYRPEYQHSWAGKSYYTRIRVDPLGDANAHVMLDALLGQSPNIEELKSLLIERTEGRPLFIEELVRSLKDARVICEENGAIGLASPLISIDLPGSVQDVIASRIDRLEPQLKRLLQTASVIGRRVAVNLLNAVVDAPAGDIEDWLSELQAKEFLYEAREGDRREFIFKHALTEEVTYASLVKEARRDLHGRVVDAIETEYADRLEENYEVIARHALAADFWEKAYEYSRRAARKAHARSAYPTAIKWFDQAVAALESLTEADDRIADKMDVRLEMRIALWPLGEHETLARRVREAGVLAEQAGDTLRLAWVHNYLTAHHWQAGEHDEAIRNGEKGIALAERAGDFSARITTMQHLGLALLARGDYVRQTSLHREVAEALVGDKALQRHGMAGYPAALSRGFLAYGLIELGAIDKAFMWAQEGTKIAHAVNSAMTTVWVTNNLALGYVAKNEPGTAVDLMRKNFEICCKNEVKLLYSQTAGLLGHALSCAGRPNEGIVILEEAVAPDNLKYHTEGLGYPIVWLAAAKLAMNELDEGLEIVRRAIEIASNQGERGHEAWALFTQAEIEAAFGNDSVDAKSNYDKAKLIAEQCKMQPLAEMCWARLRGN